MLTLITVLFIKWLLEKDKAGEGMGAMWLLAIIADVIIFGMFAANLGYLAESC